MSTLITSLLQAADTKLVGGKAGALGVMLRAGVHIPNGFAITTEAFGRMTPELEKEILNNFHQLGSKFVAVRSSAAAEDSKWDAWAGQLDTFLNVTQDELIESVKKCWDSASSERAKAYAKQKKIKVGKVAVIVQAMVQSQASGIAFSVNPVTNDKDEMVIEAGLGLNEPIVSGEIIPDTYVIDKTEYEILHKDISQQEKQYVQGKDGKNSWQKIVDGGKQKVSNGQILEVMAVVLKLEQFFGFAVDVEWTYAGGKLFILQCRPITTLQ